MTPELFASSESWHGSYYELALELGPAGDDGRLARALAALWSHPLLWGTFRDHASLAGAVGRVAGGRNPAAEGDDFGGDLLSPRCGVLFAGEGPECEVRALGCISHVVREEPEVEDEPGIEVAADWLALCVPTGMLELAFDVRYPLTRADNPWMAAMDRLFAAIGADLFAAVPFALGVIGEEVSGTVRAASLAAEACRGRGLLLPEGRSARIDPGLSTVALGPGLVGLGLGDRSG